MQAKQAKLSLKNRALRFLSLREHSRLELKRKLMRYAEEGDNVDELLDALEKSRFLSCERFSESLIRRRSESYGNHRILAELQTHGLDSELLAHSKVELAESEVARACAVWQKKFGRTTELPFGDSADCSATEPDLREQRARQIRYLAQRGFSGKAIRAAMSGCDDVPDDLD
ncbi:regulatory protein [Oxalobacteraceae bacterium GrIS 1.18]